MNNLLPYTRHGLMGTVAVWSLAMTCGLTCMASTKDATKDPATDEVRQRVQVTNTQRVDFQTGGTVRLKNSTGELTIEGWDQPNVEITTTKSTKTDYALSEREKAVHELDRVRVTAERKGSELVITTDFPKRALPPFSPFGGATTFYLDYHIKVPRDAKLVVDHNIGEVHVDGLTGDVHATALQGLIFLHLPEQAQYAIDAKSNVGSVKSDFEGTTEHRLLFGHQFIESNGPQKLYLRIRFGDIIIFKTEQPQTPGSTPVSSKP